MHPEPAPEPAELASVTNKRVTWLDGKMPIESASDARLVEELLKRVLGDELASELLATESMAETPMRMAKALRQLLDGYNDAIVSKDHELTTFASESPDDSHQNPIVIVRDIAFSSLCEHHVLPFVGHVSVAYIPGKRIVGLSKIPRIVRAYSRRLQVQERLTSQIADSLKRIDPAGVLVVVRGRHSCCSMRGAEAQAEMITSAVRGVFAEDLAARAEAMSLLHGMTR